MNHKPITAVCHVRAPLLLEPIDRQIETLQACPDDAVDDLLLRSWPQGVALTESSPHQEVIETYERFTAWADQQGVSVEPPFKHRTTTSQITGTTRELLVTPLLCLELYVGDELYGVFPHSVGAETYTTSDAIATLRTGELPTPLGEPTPTASIGTERTPIGGAPVATAVDEQTATSVGSASTDGCPSCDGSLLDGQGLLACADCDWVGTVSETDGYVSHSKQSVRHSTTPSS